MKKIILISLISIATQTGFSDNTSERLQTQLNKIHTISANFKQIVSANRREISHSSGTMVLSRPGRFRWQTLSPMKQLVLADGKHLWIYDVDLEQVTVKTQSLNGSAALFRSSSDTTLNQDFKISTYILNRKEYFELQAKSQKSNFQHMKLIFLNSKLNGIELFDQLGQRTIIKLNNVNTNPKYLLPFRTF